MVWSKLGGFRRFNELTPGQNRHMYTQERANMVSYNVMGGPRYLRLVSQHSTGTHHHADNTDEQNVGNFEESESEMEQDEMMEEDVHTREHLVNRLRTLLNECLAASEFTDAADVQQLVLMTLDAGQPGQALSATEFHSLLEQVAQRLQIRMDRARNHSRSQMAGVFARYINEFEVQLGIR